MRAPLLLLLIGGLALSSCGRSNPVPCRAREGLSCQQLVDERGLVQADFDVAVAAGDGESAALQGRCVQAFVSEQLERRCVDDPCLDLCALHPCTVKNADGTTAPGTDEAACQAQCRATSAGIARADLDAALVRAGARPGFCTCAVCDAASAALCTDLWVCAPSVVE